MEVYVEGFPSRLGWSLMELFWTGLWLAFWIGLIYLLVRAFRSRGDIWPRQSPGLEVLEERYARGEITREEFLERRTVLLDARDGFR